MKKIIYTGAFRFPDGDAAAARVLGVGKALRAAGYEVVFAGWEEHEREQDRRPDGRYVYEDFEYSSQADLRSKTLSPLKRLLGYLFAGENTLKWLGSADLEGVEAVIAYHGRSIFLSRLASFCKARNIKLITDCTEWYDAAHLVGGRFGLVRADEELRMRYQNVKIGKVLAVSSYLEKYYSRKGCAVLRVPPLIDLDEAKWSLPDGSGRSGQSGLKLTYAGTPAKKDLLGNVLRGLRILKREGITVELNLIGPTRQAVVECLGANASVLDELGATVIFQGRIPQAEVPRSLAANDFSVLLRPSARYAQAGFATKLVESLAAGVPVLANVTGDIAEFVADGKEGLLLPDHSPESFASGVKRALALTRQQKEEMRRYARLRAATSFDYKGYAERLGAFVK